MLLQPRSQSFPDPYPKLSDLPRCIRSIDLKIEYIKGKIRRETKTSMAGVKGSHKRKRGYRIEEDDNS